MSTAAFRKNDSLEPTLRRAMRADGCGIFERMIVNSRVRRLSSEGRQALEEELTKKLVADAEAGLVSLPAAGAIVGGVYVMGWLDLFEWFMENLPQILDMILAIIDMFG